MAMPPIERLHLGLSRFAKAPHLPIRVGLLFLLGSLTCCALSAFFFTAHAQRILPSVGQTPSSNTNSNRSARPDEATNGNSNLASNSQTNRNANRNARPDEATNGNSNLASNSQPNKNANDSRNEKAEAQRTAILELGRDGIRLTGFPVWSIWVVFGTLLIGFLLYYSWIKPKFYNDNRESVTILRVSLAFIAAGLLIYGGIWIGSWLSGQELEGLQTRSALLERNKSTQGPAQNGAKETETKPDATGAAGEKGELPTAVVSETYRLPSAVSPGQVVTVVGKFEQGKTVAAKIYPLGSTAGTDAQDANAVLGQASIKLPDKLAAGRYVVDLIYDGAAAERVPGELRVEATAVTLDSAYPTTAYRGAKGRFDFDIIGQNFNKATPGDNKIFISGQGQLPITWFANKDACAASKDEDLPCGWVESTEKLHVVGYQAGSYQGPLTFSVQVANGTRSPEKKLTLSRMSETGVLLWSIGIFLILAYIIYRLVASGIRDNTIHGKRHSPFWSFFIDKQTNSYSLSKVQFLLFSSVFVFGYLYVFLCRWLVQWQFALPDVPSSFAGILAISAGTTLASAGATAARGSKGAGPMGPTPADFICSGGQVIPERFQFFVWTLVACIGFLALLVSQDPSTIDKFPSFPEGLLYVMGVSAGGYLGGKLVRPTGPVIRNIVLDKFDPAKPVITIQGENLSKDADFFIDSKKLPIVPGAGDSLVAATPQEGASDRSFCTELKITISSAAALDLSTGDHDFRIMNKDGQFADTRFTADPPEIEAVFDQLTSPPSTPEKEIRSGKSTTTIAVTGKGFRSQPVVRWKPANATEPKDVPPSDVKFLDPRNLEIKLVPGDPGSGTLIVITTNGFSATATVTVV
jgi:hypothetical protein